MALYALTGRPGAGKSYSVVSKVIIPKLKAGRIVYHNLRLNEAACMAQSGGQGMLVQIDPEADAAALVEHRPPGATVIIDEVWKYWPAGIKTSQVPREQMAFFKEHRHSLDWRGQGGDVYIIDQELDSGVAKFIRDLVHRTLIHRKHDAVGMAKAFKVDVYEGAVSLTRPKASAHLSSQHARYESKYFECYKSHTQDSRGSATGLEAMEEVVDRRNTVFGSMTFKASVAALCCMPFLAWGVVASFNNIANPHGEPDEVARQSSNVTTVPSPPVKPAGPVVRSDGTPAVPVVVQAPEPEPQPEQPAAPVAHPSERLSNRWRIAGVVWRDDGTGIVLLVSSTGQRRLPSSDCEQDNAGDWWCEVGGMMATAWSGAGGPSQYSAAVAPGTTADHGYKLPGTGT